jgi:hypothetical protein
MTMDDAGKRRLALAVVRGEANWRELERLGISTRLSPAKSTMDVPADVPDVGATQSDTALGLLATASSAEALREWATAMELAIFIGVEDLQDSETGEQLLEALAAASAGEGVTHEALAIAQALVAPTTNGETPRPSPMAASLHTGAGTA